MLLCLSGQDVCLDRPCQILSDSHSSLRSPQFFWEFLSCCIFPVSDPLCFSSCLFKASSLNTQSALIGRLTHT